LCPMEKRPSLFILSSELCDIASLYNALIFLTRHGSPALVEAAVDAITQLLSKGGSYEHRKLMEAEVFHAALGLHENPSQRQLSLRLLHSIIPHLSHVIILNEDLAKELMFLFELGINFMIHDVF
jgi:hypothetical protein